MIRKHYFFNGEDGFHARPATEFAKIAREFKSKTEIIFNGETFDGKSALSIMCGCIENGCEFQLVIDGSDEKDASFAIDQKMRFGERCFNVTESSIREPRAEVNPDDSYWIISEGCSIGQAQVVNRNSYADIADGAITPETEILRLSAALDSLRSKIKHAAKISLDKNLKDILNAHCEIIDDTLFVQMIMDQIISNGRSCLSSVDYTSRTYQNKLLSLTGERMRERAADIQDVSMQLMDEISGKCSQLVIYQENTILVAESILPSDTILLDKKMVSGFVTQNGGKNCHSAIIARSMGIPAISNFKNATEVIQNGDTLIVDATKNGVVIINPDNKQLEYYKSKINDLMKERAENEKYIRAETKTLDGFKMKLVANIFDATQLKSAVACGAQGVGLFRTEFLYMNRKEPPSLEEQFECYKALLIDANGLPITIRTLDAGGDKPTPCLKMPQEDNPFLGVRAIRFCLKNKNIFNTQLKALLMASAYGNLRIMFPMIATCDELNLALNLLGMQKRLLLEQGVAVGNYSVGIMIETPSAVILSPDLAKKVDFFSIGTNDLTQYTMAADRGSMELADLNSSYQPAVLRSINYVVEVAKNSGIWVGICGESGSDKLLAPLYLCMGVSELSMNESSIAAIRRIINRSNRKELSKKCDLVFSKSTAKEVQNILEDI